MPATLVGSDAVGFADGNGGHVYTFPAGAPAAGDLDVLCINSNTVVATPAGFAVATSRVGGQGAYVFWRKATGGEPGTVTITTAGDHNTVLVWSRWSGVDTLDQVAVSGVDGAGGLTSPAVTMPPLAGAGELVVASAALHALSEVVTGPVWSSGYAELQSMGQGGVGSSAVHALVAARTDGSGVESPSVSWAGSAADRYMLVAAFTASAAGVVLAGTAATTAAFTAIAAGTRIVAGSAVGSATLTATAAGTPQVPGKASTAIGYTATAAGLRTVKGTAALAISFTSGTTVPTGAVTLRATAHPAATFRPLARPRVTMEVGHA